jgi:hypothetical protein
LFKIVILEVTRLPQISLFPVCVCSSLLFSFKVRLTLKILTLFLSDIPE